MATERSYLTPYAQNLRSHMTQEEIRLWTSFLRGLSVTVQRQKPIGPYIVDYYIASKKTVIELDGFQHFEESGRQSDKVRDEYFQSMGITVLRYSNSDVNRNFRAVCEDILNRLGLPPAECP